MCREGNRWSCAASVTNVSGGRSGSVQGHHHCRAGTCDRKLREVGIFDLELAEVEVNPTSNK